VLNISAKFAPNPNYNAGNSGKYWTTYANLAKFNNFWTHILAKVWIVTLSVDIILINVCLFATIY
jgi:hypothetical protein